MGLKKGKDAPVLEDLGGLPHNTNDALARIHESNDEANNPTVTGKVERDTTLDRKKNETLAEYTERVPVGEQPVQPGPALSYLGKPL